VPFVLDSSVCLVWAFDDETSVFAEEVLDQLNTDGAAVPAIWPLEIMNTLIVGERRVRITLTEIEDFQGFLTTLPIALDDTALTTALVAVFNIARSEQLTVYDATYLELALRLGLPLATLDTRLRDAATRVGVPLLA
jgi:predicted nucleic acid-binding protein